MSKGSLKFYLILLGMGIGFIFAGIYFYIYPQIEYKYVELTDDEILERAKIIKLEAAKDISNNDEDTDDITDTEEDESLENNESSTNEDAIGDSNNEPGQAEDSMEEEEQEETNNEEQADDEAPEQEEDEANNDIDENLEDEQVVEYATVKIEKGDSSETIAQKLFDAGVIDDPKAFHEFIKERKAEGNLDYGQFTLIKGADFESLLDELIVN